MNKEPTWAYASKTSSPNGIPTREEISRSITFLDQNLEALKAMAFKEIKSWAIQDGTCKTNSWIRCLICRKVIGYVEPNEYEPQIYLAMAAHGEQHLRDKARKSLSL
jgi:hypothetical protein